MGLCLGYGTHLVGDGYGHVVTGDWAALVFIVWPLFPIPNADTELEGLLAHLRNIEGSPLFLFGLALTGAAFVLWARHGWPGVATLGDWVRRRTVTERAR